MFDFSKTSMIQSSYLVESPYKFINKEKLNFVHLRWQQIACPSLSRCMHKTFANAFQNRSCSTGSTQIEVFGDNYTCFIPPYFNKSSIIFLVQIKVTFKCNIAHGRAIVILVEFKFKFKFDIFIFESSSSNSSPVKIYQVFFEFRK